MKKEYLMTPGPSTVPPQTLLDMAQPMFHHRTPRFKEIFADVNANLKKVFKTENPVVTFTSSGTGALEAAVVNTMSPGDKAIVINGGKFGERYLKICDAYCINTVEIPVKWGTAVDPSVVEKALKDNPDAKAVCSTLCETSTGVVSDVKALGAIVAKTDAILICDAISGLAADDICTDEWNVDMVVGGSQKALMLPPGLAFLSVSDKAKAMIETSKCQKFYFNLKQALKTYTASDTPWTPAVTLVVGAQRSLQMIVDEGIDNVVARHARLAEALRSGVQAIGLDLYAPTVPSNAVTSVKIPDGVDGLAFVKKVRDERGVTIAGGQAEVKGKIFRVAAMGYAGDYDVVTALAATEQVLHELGYSFEIGESVKAALKVLI